MPASGSRRGKLVAMDKPLDYDSPDASASTPLLSKPVAFIFVLLAIAVLYLRWQGRVWWCKCRQWYPVSIHVNSMHNSQHLFDPYSLSHVLHGILFFGVLWLFRRRLSLGV